jgi:hypothetical protein
MSAYARATEHDVEMILSAYLSWRDVCRAVDDAYRAWVSGTGPGGAVAFWRYTAALDAEECAAEAYASSWARSSGRLGTLRCEPDPKSPTLSKDAQP